MVFSVLTWKSVFQHTIRGNVDSISMQPDGKRIAILYDSVNSPDQLDVFSIPSGKKETVLAPSFSNLSLRLQSATYPSFDGLRIPVDIYSRAGTPKENPVVIWIHGGPHDQTRPGFAPFFHLLSRMGYWVVTPNIRGSTGYGKRYAQLDKQGKRKNAIQDLAYLHRYLVKRGHEPTNMGLWGASYGGYMVLAGLAFQPTLWKAGVSRVGFGNLFSMIHNTVPHRRHYRIPEYGNPKTQSKMLRSLSPFFHVNKIAAPLLILHGKNDTRVPVLEAQTMYRKLKKQGNRVEMKIYPDEGHGIGKKKNKTDSVMRTIHFFQKYLPVE